MDYPDTMDVECVKLCDAMNKLSGIETYESCCGHDKIPFFVAFVCSSFESLATIAKAIYETDWTIEAGWASGSNDLYFTLAGPAEFADHLADKLS